MRYVTVPSPIQLVDLETGAPAAREITKDGTVIPDEPWSFWRFIARFVLSDPKIGTGEKGAKCVNRIKRSFENAQPGVIVIIDDIYCDAVCGVLDEPANAWAMSLAGQLWPFMAAFKSAPSEMPEPLAMPAPQVIASQLADVVVPEAASGAA